MQIAAPASRRYALTQNTIVSARTLAYLPVCGLFASIVIGTAAKNELTLAPVEAVSCGQQ